MLRRPGKYKAPGYHDSKDKRLVEIVRHRKVAAEGAVNLLGVPFDGAVLGRRGASGGPEGMREAMSSFSNYNLELGVGLSGARVFDLGDVVFENQDVEDVHVSVEGEVSECLRDDSMLVIMGGDNSISLPAIRAFAGRYGEVGVIVIDSHLDLRGEINGKPTSGSSYGLALSTVNGVSPRRFVEIGIHGFLNSEVYVEKARELGVTQFTADDVEEKGAKAVAESAYRTASKGAKAVYLSVDLDAVDMSQVSGVSAPSVGGITAGDLLKVAFYLGGRSKVKCADIVELAPSLDLSGRSQRVAATALVYLVAGFVSRQRG